jgi:hypothetical protein
MKRITIVDGLTPASDRVFRIHRRNGVPSRRTAMVFRSAIGFRQLRSWAACITNTDWNGPPERPALDACVVFAEDTCWSITRDSRAGGSTRTRTDYILTAAQWKAIHSHDTGPGVLDLLQDDLVNNSVFSGLDFIIPLDARYLRHVLRRARRSAA